MKFDDNPFVDLAMQKMVLALTMFGIDSEGGIIPIEEDKLAGDMGAGWDGPSVVMLLQSMATAGHLLLFEPQEVAPTFRMAIMTDESLVEIVRGNVSNYIGRPVPRTCPAVREIVRQSLAKRCVELMGLV